VLAPIVVEVVVAPAPVVPSSVVGSPVAGPVEDSAAPVEPVGVTPVPS
jgi:hypothetical protein